MIFGHRRRTDQEKKGDHSNTFRRTINSSTFRCLVLRLSPGLSCATAASIAESIELKGLHGSLRANTGSGNIKVNGSKNAALPLMAAALLAEGPTYLAEVPNLSDINHQINLLRELGRAECEFRPVQRHSIECD